MNKTTEIKIMESKELREKMINNVQVLEKVKELILLADTGYATVNQVANYFEVDKKLIEYHLKANKDELESDGVKVIKGNELKDFKTHLVKLGALNLGKTNTLTLIPKRAILRLGMVIEKSLVAKKVRTALLNIIHDVQQESPQIINNVANELTELQILQIKAMEAYTSNDIENFAKYNMMINGINNKRVKEIEDKNKALTLEKNVLIDGITEWSYQQIINKLVRKIGYQIFKGVISSAWQKLYGEIYYKHNISINSRITKSKRKNATIFDVIYPAETQLVLECAIALCERYDMDISEILIHMDTSSKKQLENEKIEKEV